MIVNQANWQNSLCRQLSYPAWPERGDPVTPVAQREKWPRGMVILPFSRQRHVLEVSVNVI
jgi:hypothetical protein